LTKNLHPLQVLPYAIVDILKSLFQFGKWLSLSDSPVQSIDIPDDFFGVNVAAADDPVIDDYIVERLTELGISQVRMDFAYSSKNAPAQRLLDKLLDQGFQVLLDVFPNLEEAKILYKSREAQEQWASFLADIFQRYQGKVAYFEIGATPNRGKWSGFSSRSFLTAWHIANSVAKNYQVTLAGPNVSDFEPIFNATYLSLLRRIGGVPKIHTDNLFVERVIEPEAYDHRVFGRLATDTLKLNLIKKARILQNIGRDKGCDETWCTYTCWTRKRLNRRAAWPEDKAADYLVRYLALAAVSGALKRVYWGPLICSRDGLINAGDGEYPVIDQVSFYQCISSDQNKFTISPVFYAFKNTIARFSGARCVKSVHQVNGVSLFSFRGAGGKEFQLCWCRDGKSWPLTEFFTEDVLARAHFSDAVGQPIPRPEVICEHPVFIDINNSSLEHTDRELTDATPQAIIHLSSPDYQSIAHRDSEWVGAYMLRRSKQHGDLGTVTVLYPEAIEKLEETAVLRDSRNRIWNVVDPRGLTAYVTVKLNRTVGFKRFSYRFRPSKGRRHWNNACEMLRRGVSTPLPVAFHERPNQSGVKDSWYLCEYIPDAFSARDVYAAFRDGADSFEGLDKYQWFTLLSTFVCEMHNRQIVHRDLSAGNFLIHRDSNGNIQPMLIDIGRTWLGRGTGIKQRHRMLDLIRIAYKLNWEDREAFIKAYESHLGRPLSALWRIPFHYYDNKQRLKKSMKRKYRKKRHK
jgi:hypothetical protein